MMSDEPTTEGPVDDPKVTQGRHRCIVLALLFIAACAIAAIVLPLVLDDCDCPSIPNIRSTFPPTAAPIGTTSSPIPTDAPAAVPAPTLSPAPTSSPTSVRLGQFIETFLVPVSGQEVFEDPNTPQFRAAEFLANVDTVGATLENTAQLGDRYALSTFYYAMDGDDSWFTCYQADQNCTTGNSWMDPEVDHCEWSAIRCSEEGRVVDLFFATSEGNGLVGTIPPEIALLTELQNFVAVNNLIGGSFPESFGEMTSLRRVVLATNVMTGQIPEGFLADAPLELFMVSNNRFSGAIPSSFGMFSTLTQLHLANNQFDGTIPAELADVELLGTLDLSDNDRLRGSIPSEIYGMSNLENFFLNGCRNIQGELPSAIGGLTSIIALRLGGTGLRGPLPAALFTLNNISELDLTGAGFSGSLSENFALLAGSLRILRLANNSFSGDIPAAFDSLVLLNVLELAGNNLTGQISDTTCGRRGDGRTELNELTADCEEVTCDCCTNCVS